MTVSDWIGQARSRLQKLGLKSSSLESQILACKGLGESRAWLIGHGESVLSIEQIQQLEGLLVRRLNHEPLAYIVGKREFYGRDFIVDSRVLIPRQETEILVEYVLAHCQLGQSVLDLACGSGCIGITLALERPDLQVVASDVSADALAVAAGNSERLSAKVKFVESDLLSGFRCQKFNWIVSNPPYVASDDNLSEEVKDFEPSVALYGGDDGLDIYRRLAEEAADFLENAGGQLVVELGAGQVGPVLDLFLEAEWQHVATRDDLGLIPRMIAFSRPHGSA